MENTTNHLNKTKPIIKTFVTGDATHNRNLFFEERRLEEKEAILSWSKVEQ